MNTFVADSYKVMSKQAVNDLILLIPPSGKPLLCPASGDTPAGLYKEIIDQVNKKQLDTSDWYFVGLDEWVGFNAGDEGSCRFHLNQQLFQPLKINDDKICFFNGRANDLRAECRQVENFIGQHGGIHVAIVGLGMNGHLGMNEPGVSQALRSHVATIDSTTQEVGQKYFKKKQALDLGITLGLATLLEARHIMLLVSGRHKAEIVRKVFKEEISEQLPATLLRNHPGLRIYLDKEAASLINDKYPDN